MELFFENKVLQYRYANGVVVHAEHFPGDSTGSSGGARFVGTEGWIAVDREHLTAQFRRILERPLDPNGVRLYHSDSHSGNFLDCVRTRKRTICDVETAHRSASAVLLGGLALQLQRPLKWDPRRANISSMTTKPTGCSPWPIARRGKFESSEFKAKTPRRKDEKRMQTDKVGR